MSLLPDNEARDRMIVLALSLHGIMHGMLVASPLQLTLPSASPAERNLLKMSQWKMQKNLSHQERSESLA